MTGDRPGSMPRRGACGTCWMSDRRRSTTWRAARPSIRLVHWAALTSLELEGWVIQEPGMRFRRAS